MEVSEAIRKRRSIKTYQTKEVPRETITKLLQAASLAPSGGNKQPWEFVVVTGREKLKEMGQVQQHSQWLAEAQAAIVLVADPGQGKYWLEDCCAAAENIWLEATGLGLGVAWAAIYQSDPPESKRRESIIRNTLKIPEKYRVVTVLGLGYPAEQPKERELRPFQEMTHWEEF